MDLTPTSFFDLLRLVIIRDLPTVNMICFEISRPMSLKFRLPRILVGTLVCCLFTFCDCLHRQSKMGKTCKVVVCGQAAVGKTAILEQLINGDHVVGSVSQKELLTSLFSSV